MRRASDPRWEWDVISRVQGVQSVRGQVVQRWKLLVWTKRRGEDWEVAVEEVRSQQVQMYGLVWEEGIEVKWRWGGRWR